MEVVPIDVIIYDIMTRLDLPSLIRFKNSCSQIKSYYDYRIWAFRMNSSTWYSDYKLITKWFKLTNGLPSIIRDIISGRIVCKHFDIPKITGYQKLKKRIFYHQLGEFFGLTTRSISHGYSCHVIDIKYVKHGKERSMIAHIQVKSEYVVYLARKDNVFPILDYPDDRSILVDKYISAYDHDEIDSHCEQILQELDVEDNHISARAFKKYPGLATYLYWKKYYK